MSVFSLPLACGGSSGGSACSAAACGGDITGTWTASDICLSKSVLMMTFVQSLMGVCPGAALGNTNVTTSGSFVFNTDSTYSIDITMGIAIDVNLPLSCFPTGTTCAVVDTAIMQAVAGNASIQSASCAGTNPCACTLTEVPQQIIEQGTYSRSASSLVTTPTTTGATPSKMTYCVKDKTLTMQDASPDPANPVTAFVATKP